MDEATLSLLTFVGIALGIISLIGRQSKKDDIWAAFAFVGGLISLLTFNALNSDGAIQVPYGTGTISIWPLAYLPLIFVILDWGIGLYITIGRGNI